MAQKHAIHRLSQLAAGKMDKVLCIFHEAHNLTQEIDIGDLKGSRAHDMRELVSSKKYCIYNHAIDKEHEIR